MNILSHITLICQDIEKSAHLFKTLLNAEEVYSSDNHNFSLSREKFLLIGPLWIALMEGKSLLERTYNHIAFRIDVAEIDVYKTKIQDLGLELLPSRPRDPAEGQSLYFYDYDNHLFELHTGDLKTRLDYYTQSSY